MEPPDWRGPGSYSIRSLTTRGSRAVLNPLLLSLTADPDYDLRDTILVAGWARSGTTWLAEILSTIPRSAILFEPLSKKLPDAAAAGFPVHEIPRPGEGSPAQQAYMRRALQGRVLNWWTCSVTPLRRAIRPRLWIVKEIGANFLIDWIAGTFGVRRIILIIRHPCATIASRMAQGWRPDLGRIAVKQRAARRRFPHLEPLCQNLKDPYEVMAARWCLKNYVPLALRPRPFRLVAYESLATRGVGELLPAFADWKLEVPPAIQQSLVRASATTKAGAVRGVTHRQRIDHWKHILARDQIDRILRVVHAFGMDFYSDDTEPDYERLSAALPS